MDDERTDYRLWAVWSAVSFLLPWLPLVGLGINARHLQSPACLLQEGWCVTLFLAVVAVTFGWAVQSVVVAQGERRPGRRWDPQDDDYRDPPAG